VSLNRWVFKWRLKVRMFSHSRMSAGREFQVDAAATGKARQASSVCMRGTTNIGASTLWQTFTKFHFVVHSLLLSLPMMYARCTLT